MEQLNIGFVHPGAMGISLAASAQATGHFAYWSSKGRSPETFERAQAHKLSQTLDLSELCETCSVIISVCPPHAAIDVAREVIACAYKGIYADVNAIAPQKSIAIGKEMTQAGIDFVDGGVIGGPAWQPESTWLYLSGPSANQVADCFSNGPLETEVMGVEIGKASAIKMSFAAYTKGSTALLSTIMAAADEMGIRKDLEKQWSRNGSDFSERTRQRVQRVTAKAWRFSGEMEEIASTMAAAGLPPGFHLAAAGIFKRMSHFKGADPLPALQEVLDCLKNKGDEDP